MRKWIGIAVLGIVQLACGGGTDATPSGPSPSTPVIGVLKVALATPNADDGAMLFTISGGIVTSVDPASSRYQVYLAHPDGTTTRVLITGDLSAGDVVLLHVPDTRASAAYRGSVSEAASRATYAPQDVGAYRLTVSP